VLGLGVDHHAHHVLLTWPVLVIWSVIPMFLYRLRRLLLEVVEVQGAAGFMATAPVRNFLPDDSGWR